MPSLRRQAPRPGALYLRALRGEEKRRQPGPRCAAARRGKTAPGPDPRKRIRARAVAQGAGRAPGREHLHPLRQGAGGERPFIL